ncbi:MAG: hypothetical protein ACYCV4_15410 [Dermatophilaceae bacterium]
MSRDILANELSRRIRVTTDPATRDDTAQVPRYLLPIMDLDLWSELLMVVEERKSALRERLAVLTRDEDASPGTSLQRAEAMAMLAQRIEMDETLWTTIRTVPLNPAYDYVAMR